MQTFTRLAGVLLVLCMATGADASSLTDRVLAELIWQHLPEQLYGQDQNPWPGGSYQVQVFKQGRPQVASQPGAIHLRLPLRVVIRGRASSDLLGLRMTCEGSFVSEGSVVLRPEKAGEVRRLQSTLDLPVPPVTADCQTLQLSVEPYLRAFVAQNKRQWEERLDAEINALLAGETP